MIPKNQMPHYSTDQYKLDLCEDESRFAFCIIKILGMTYNPELIFEKLKDGLLGAINQRISVVTQGHEFCLTRDCSPGTIAWEDWSTPTRDSRLLQTINTTAQTISSINMWDQFMKWVTEEQIIVSHNSLSIKDFYNRLNLGFVSSDPRDEIEQRWAANTEAIYQTVKKQLHDSNEQRNRLIPTAQPCRNNPKSCQDSKSLFEKYSTLELDFKQRILSSNWMSFCKDTVCPQDKNLSLQMNKVWFQSPAPWDSIEKRQGVIDSRAHLLMANMVQKAGKKHLILDQKNLYHIDSKTIVFSFPENIGFIGYDEHTNQIYTLENSKIIFYNSDFKKVTELEYVIDSESPRLYPLGNGIYLMTSLIDQSIQGPPVIISEELTKDETISLIIDMSKHLVTSKVSARKISHDNEMYLLTGNNNQLLFQQKNKIILKDFPQFDGYIGSFKNLGEEKFLVQVSSFSTNNNINETSTILYGVNKNHVQIIKNFETAHIEIERLNSHFFQIQSWRQDASFHYLLDNNFKIHTQARYILKIGSFGIDQFLFYKEISPDNWKSYVLDGDSIREINIQNNNNIEILSVNDTWLLSSSQNNFNVINFQGKILEKHAFRSKTNCKDYYQPIRCGGNKKLLVETYHQPLSGSLKLNLSRVGLADNWNIQDSFGYIIKEDNESFGFSSNNNFEINTGNSIKLSDHLMLWFP